MTQFPLQGKTIFVAGHRGMVGSALLRRLAREDCTILTADRSDLDLIDTAKVSAFLARHRPDAVVVAAARVGGILANDSQPAPFLYENLMIEANLVHGAHVAGINRLLLLGSSCIYPRNADQPIEETALLTGPLEPTNEWYAVAKIAGIKLCQAYRKQYGRDYISAMPTNLYGPGDNFSLGSSHVLPALLRRAHEAKHWNMGQMTLWGSGTPRREFLHVDDCADALVLLLQNYSSPEPINIGCGRDITILELAWLVCSIVGFEGEITLDTSMPDGTPRKLLSIEKLRRLGWEPQITLREGIERTYQWFLATADGGERR